MVLLEPATFYLHFSILIPLITMAMQFGVVLKADQRWNMISPKQGYPCTLSLLAHLEPLIQTHMTNH